MSHGAAGVVAGVTAGDAGFGSGAALCRAVHNRAPLTSGELLTESTANAAGRPQRQRPIAAGARGFSSAPHPAPHRRTQLSGAASRWKEPAGKSLLERARRSSAAALQRSSSSVPVAAGTAPARASRRTQRRGALPPTRRFRSRDVPAVPAARVAESHHAMR